MNLLYQNSGWFQFGYRFSNDYAVLLFVMLASAVRRMGRAFWVAAVWAIALEPRSARSTFEREKYGALYSHDAERRLPGGLSDASRFPSRSPLAPALLLVLVVALALAACGKPPDRAALRAGRPAGGVDHGDEPRRSPTARASRSITRATAPTSCPSSCSARRPDEHEVARRRTSRIPTRSSGTFTHMIAFNLSPELRKLPSAPDLARGRRGGALRPQRLRRRALQGPCPPKGEAHRYRFRVVALDTMLKLPEGRLAHAGRRGDWTATSSAKAR